MDGSYDCDSAIGGVRVLLFADDIMTSSPFNLNSVEASDTDTTSISCSPIESKNELEQSPPSITNKPKRCLQEEQICKAVPSEIYTRGDRDKNDYDENDYENEQEGIDENQDAYLSESSSSLESSSLESSSLESSSSSSSSPAGSTSRSTEDLTTPTIPAFLNFMKNNEGFIPIDIQYSIPAMAIVILYCFAHLALYDVIIYLISYLTDIHPNPVVHNMFLMAFGFLLLRCSGGLWFWATCVDSDSYYYQFKATNNLRKKMAKKISAGPGPGPFGEHNRHDNDNDNTQKKNSQQVFTKLETAKRNILVKDTRILRWFKHQWTLSCIIQLFGFYCIYVPCSYFYSDTCMWYASIPRIELISGLPSLQKQNSINLSSVFRSMLIAGPSPLLSDLEMEMWGEGPVLKLDAVCSAEDTCPATNGNYTSDSEAAAMKTFLELSDSLYYADDEYLQSKVSSSSYYSFNGWYQAYFLTQYGQLAVSAVVFGLSFFLLTRMKINVFTI